MPELLKKIYKSASYLLLNSLIIFILLNCVIYCWYKAVYSPLGRQTRAALQKGEAEKYKRAYEGAYSVEEIYAVIDEQRQALKLEYQPWVLFREPGFEGRYTHVAREGYRLNSGPGETQARGKGPVIFAFGGSTMFGYGVKDGDTIAAYIEKAIPGSRVYNFGRAFYYSSQEMQLFLSLVKEGKIPDIAVFLDGLNDTRVLADGVDEPYLSSTLRNIFKTGFYLGKNVMPVLTALYDIREARAEQKGAFGLDDAGIKKRAAAVLAIYRSNEAIIRQIAAYYHVKTYFFWQPVPHYSYDLSNHQFKKKEHYPGDSVYRLYNEVYRSAATGPMDGTVFLGNIFKDKKDVYIDRHHYNPSGCRMIAEEIVRVVKQDNPDLNVN